MSKTAAKKITLHMRVDAQRLAPIDPYSAELIETDIPRNTDLTVVVSVERSKSELNFYWAGLGFLHQRALDDVDRDRWPTVSKLHESIMEKLGYTSIKRHWRLDWRSNTGTAYWDEKVIDSIALDKMRPDEFKVLFERVRVAIIQVWGFDPWDEWKAWKAEQAAAMRAKQDSWRT